MEGHQTQDRQGRGRRRAGLRLPVRAALSVRLYDGHQRLCPLALKDRELPEKQGEALAVPVAAPDLRLPLPGGPNLFLEGLAVPGLCPVHRGGAGLCLSFLVFFWYQIPLWLAGALLVPMLLDGGIQLTTRYESTNPRRLVTGFAFGFGLYVLFGHSILFAFWQGYHFLQ